ncbi:MAG: hypothetical protein GX897_00490 [Clostridiales bacterium]|nr:hypothetical protein [Clostridiales bacterium]
MDNNTNKISGKSGDISSESKPDKKRKMLIAVVISIAVMTILLFLNNFDWDKLALSTISTKKTLERNFVFAAPDYEADIFTDPQYLDKNRYISYTDGAESSLITDENYSMYGEPLVLFAEYFDAARHGDAGRLNALFTDEYWKEHDKYSDFTMQRIYNIEITLLSDAAINDGDYKGYRRRTYDISYMIMKNDGLFRSDMSSDSAVPLVFELLTYGDSTKINSITAYNYIVYD